MKENRLLLEQSSSLVSRLVSAGIEHGDTAELTLEGVGAQQINGLLVLAFCPTRVFNCNIIRRGTVEDRQRQIPQIVRLSGRLRNRLLWRAPENGFFRLRLNVHSNGVLLLNGRVLAVEHVPQNVQVCRANSYEYCKHEGLIG